MNSFFPYKVGVPSTFPLTVRDDGAEIHVYIRSDGHHTSNSSLTSKSGLKLMRGKVSTLVIAIGERDERKKKEIGEGEESSWD